MIKSCLILIYLSIFALSALAKPQIVIYPKREMTVDRRLEFHLAVLQLALGHFPGKYIVQSSEYPIPQSRRFLDLLKEDSSLSLTWSMTSKEREESGVIPVRFPIDQGLLGLRVLLIKKEKVNQFASADQAAIRKLKYGLQHDWPDRTIFEKSGFSVVAGPMYESLFEMLLAERFDAFPRSVLEVTKEQISYQNRGLVVDKKWLFRYPTANYFFVNPQRAELAQDLEAGLLKSQNDGSFSQLLDSYFGDELKALQLDQRTVVDLANPLAPKASPLKGFKLWHPLVKSW